MSSSFLEDKINDLQARLKAETENETPERTNNPKDLGISALASPRQGSGRRPKQPKCIECYQCESGMADASDCNYLMDKSSPDLKPKSCSSIPNAKFCVKKVAQAHQISCYQCTAPENMDCGDAMIHMDDGGTVRSLSCDHIYDARFCIKSTGNYGGGLGTKRFCSALDMGNYCNYVKQPGVDREYRSCVYTCDSDGCNSAHLLKPVNLFFFSTILISLYMGTI